MDHDEAPVLDALAEYHRRGYRPFTPPGHKRGFPATHHRGGGGLPAERSAGRHGDPRCDQHESRHVPGRPGRLRIPYRGTTSAGSSSAASRSASTGARPLAVLSK